MDDRPITKFRPGLERLEAKRPLSAGMASAPLDGLKAASRTSASHANEAPSVQAEAIPLTTTNTIPRVLTNTGTQLPNFGYLLFRITNPITSPVNQLGTPFGHVFVQSNQPVPGQVYNILQVAVKNGTNRTFDATSNFNVQFPNNPRNYPILTGNATWKPGQDYIFYVLSKQYYPLPSQVHSGFIFILDGARSIGIPGPSGIFLRVKYNPATFDQTLDRIVAHGPGAQGGKGIPFGLPDTAIYEFIPSNAKPRRLDYSGYF